MLRLFVVCYGSGHRHDAILAAVLRSFYFKKPDSPLSVASHFVIYRSSSIRPPATIGNKVRAARAQFESKVEDFI
eukprot:scaffold2903_cov170-Amphora_coffeaeformis.AAC.7